MCLVWVWRVFSLGLLCALHSINVYQTLPPVGVVRDGEVPGVRPARVLDLRDFPHHGNHHHSSVSLTRACERRHVFSLGLLFGLHSIGLHSIDLPPIGVVRDGEVSGVRPTRVVDLRDLPHHGHHHLPLAHGQP